MSSIPFEGLSAKELIGMADVLVRRGDLDTARQMYDVALARATGGEVERLQIRIGVARKADRRLLPTLDVLTALERLSLVNNFVGDGLATWMKTLPFFGDARFMALSERHVDLLPLRNWQWNLQTALWAVQQARGIEGDLVELGVFRGHTTLFCAEYVDFAAWPKRWWLYDTFEGIPDDQVDAGWEAINKRIYSAATFSYEEVRDRFAHIPNVEVIKGRVPEILAERSPAKIAFLHIDMNNVVAEIAALEALYDRVTPGGVILFDDYMWQSARAQHAAEKAWFAARGEQILGLPTGQGVYVKR